MFQHETMKNWPWTSCYSISTDGMSQQKCNTFRKKTKKTNVTHAKCISLFWCSSLWTNKGKTTIKTITERCLSNASSHQVSFRASYSCFVFLSHKEPALGQEMCIRAAPFLCCTRTSQWLDKANAASQMIWKSKSRKLQNTDVRGCCESLKRRICRTALWSSAVRRNKPDGVARVIFNWARDRSLNSLAADIDVRFFFFFLDFRSPFLQFARMRCKLMFFQVKSRVCPDASDVWQIHGQQS